MLMMRNQSNLFSSPIMPNEIVQLISDYEPSNSKIEIALKCAASPQKERVRQLLIMLDNNPTLLLQAGRVITPGGDIIKRTTIYEFCLGAGDADLAKKVQHYFSQITNGEQQRIRQYKRYQCHIENMLKQKPYDLTKLINLVKSASMDDVIALLNYDETHTSELGNALIQFKQDWQPKTIEQSSMHYNYNSLHHAFKQLSMEWEELYRKSNYNFSKIHLVWRQIIGFEMRRLPGIDRCIMAQGIYYYIKKGLFNRTYEFKNSYRELFPDTDHDDSSEISLGKKFAIDVLFGARSSSRCSARVRQEQFFNYLDAYFEQKQADLKNLYEDNLQLIEQSVYKYS